MTKPNQAMERIPKASESRILFSLDDKTMFGLLLMFVGGIGAMFTWILAIRPYVTRSGESPVTGVNWGVSAWADWQTCREFARLHRDARGLGLARSFGVWHVVSAAGFLLLLGGV
jgi:hypothetical protein